MQTRAKRVLVVGFDEVDLLELATPIAALARAGRHWNFKPFALELAAPARGPIATRELLRVEASCALVEAAPPEILLVPGGYGARRAAAEPAITRELARLAGSAELVCGLGTGVLLLASAGLVGARRVAARAELRPLLEAVAPDVQIDASFEPVLDAPLLTARGGGSALALALAIVEWGFGKKLRAMLEGELGLSGERLEILPGAVPSPLKPRD